MNLPNKLSMFRILLIPIIMIVYSIPQLRINWIFYENLTVANFIVLLLIFLGALTDALDGHIARKHNLITNLGKFLDPLADKLLTCAGFVILLQQNMLNQTLTARFVEQPASLIFVDKNCERLLEWWMLIVILAREFMVTGIRLLAAGQGKVIAASKFGKIKTTCQFVTILFLLAFGAVSVSNSVINPLQTWAVITGKVMLLITVAITIFSGYDYLVKNIGVFKDISKKKSK